MNPVKIFVDSTIDLRKEEVKRLGITVLPLHIRFGEKEYLDGVDVTPEEIFKHVDGGGELPKTSAVAVGVFQEEFEKAVKEGFDVIFIGLGSQLSGTFQSAVIAASDLPEGRVFPIDSKSLSSGTGLLVYKIAKLRDEGKSAKEISDIVTPLADKVVAQFVLDRLDYMEKGGRCSGFANLMARLLHIHPLLRMVDGKLIVYRKPRGKWEVCLDEMLALAKEDMPVDLDHVMITHSGSSKETIDRLVNGLSQIIDPSIIEISTAGGVISSHCGNNCIGILYIKK